MALAPILAGNLGSDYSKEELAERGQVVKGQIPVHGYWVNWEDVFFYTGDTQAFNQFVEAYGHLDHAGLKVVIHAGTTGARSPWDKADRGPADWYFYRWNTGIPGPAISPRRREWRYGWAARSGWRSYAYLPTWMSSPGGEIEKFIAGRKVPAPTDKPEKPPLMALDGLPMPTRELAKTERRGRDK